MYLLLAWVLVAVVIPEGIGYLAEYSYPPDTTKELISNVDKQYTEAMDKIPQPKFTWMWGAMDRHGGEALLSLNADGIQPRIEYHKATFSMKLQRVEEKNKVMDDYAASLNKWKRIRDSFLRSSLCVIYKNIATAISGTDINTYNSTIQRIKIYRGSLVDYLRPKTASAKWFTRVDEHPEMLPTKENEAKWEQMKVKEGSEAVYKIFTWDRITSLDVGDMPLPNIAFPDAVERISYVTLDIIILFLFAIMFLVLACWRAAYYKVN
jgi:hypothetical protein